MPGIHGPNVLVQNRLIVPVGSPVPTWYRTKRFGPRTVLGPDQDRKIFENLGPRPRSISKPGIGPDQKSFENLGPNQTRTEKNFKTWDRTGPGPRKISESRTGPGPTKF